MERSGKTFRSDGLSRFVRQVWKLMPSPVLHHLVSRLFGNGRQLWSDVSEEVQQSRESVTLKILHYLGKLHWCVFPFEEGIRNGCANQKVIYVLFTSYQ